MSKDGQIRNTSDFEQFFKAYHGQLLRYAHKFVHRHDVASDIVQDAFMKLWENRANILITVSLSAYLHKTIYNLCLNYLEQIKIRAGHHEVIQTELLEKELDFYKDETSLLQQEMSDTVARLVEKLPLEYKQVMELSRYEGLKNKEIAEKLEIPLRTVETRIYRSIKQLKDALRKQP